MLLKLYVFLVGPTWNQNRPPMYINDRPIQQVDKFKYLIVNFIAKCNLVVEVSFVKRKFHAALTSVSNKCRSAADMVKVHLVQSYCLPILMYLLGALELNSTAVNDLSVCWNDAFRLIFHYNRWESVKQLQYCCGSLDFKHMYDLARYKFLLSVEYKLAYFRSFYVSIECRNNTLNRLHDNYVGLRTVCYASAVYEHFNHLVCS